MEFHQNSALIPDVYRWNASGIPLEYRFKIPAFFLEGKQLMSPQKIFVSSAKLTILISWSPVCTPLILCHYHLNGWQSWLQQQAETWRVGNPAKLPT